MGFTADPYDILKIKPTADSTEISKTFHNLARQLHPDKNDAPNAKEVFQQVNQAYQVLSDPVERSKLDDQRAAKERELQKLQQAREIQLKYQQQLIEQKTRERAFQVQEHQQKLQQQKLAREQQQQALRNQMTQNKMTQNKMNQNPIQINKEMIIDPHHDATAKWLLEQFGIQDLGNNGNNSNLRVDSVKKRSKSPCNLAPGGNGTSIPSRSPSPAPPGVNQGAYIQINRQPRANNVQSMNNIHNMNNMQNMNSMNNMNNANSMNRTNSVKFQQRPQGNVYNQQIPSNVFNQQKPSNVFNQQIPSQGFAQNGYQHIRVDSRKGPRPLPKTPVDVKLRQQDRSNSMVFDLSMLEAQLKNEIGNNPEPRMMQTQLPQNPKVMLIKVVSNPLVH